MATHRANDTVSGSSDAIKVLPEELLDNDLNAKLAYDRMPVRDAELVEELMFRHVRKTPVGSEEQR